MRSSRDGIGLAFGLEILLKLNRTAAAQLQREPASQRLAVKEANPVRILKIFIFIGDFGSASLSQSIGGLDGEERPCDEGGEQAKFNGLNM